VAPPHFQVGGAARQQRQRDAAIGLLAEQRVGVVEAERQADHGRDRRQRDVAFVEGQPHADHARAVPLALADDAVVGD
jgi:hypothetical protein